MNARERFHATFTYGQPDRVFLQPQWTFNDTRRRWLREGMPRDVHFNTYFGFDRIEGIPINFGVLPPLETKVVEQTAHWSIVEDELGGLTKRWTDREVVSKVPELVKSGGFSPMVDYAVPRDVPFANFRYYVDLIQDICTSR